jgi:hypothetical protein
MSAFWHMANLEASRLESEGDMAGAWQWYRAWLRTLQHQEMHGVTWERFAVEHLEPPLRVCIAHWAADRRVDARLLQQAVADALEADALVASDLFTLKAEYLEAMRELDDHVNIFQREHDQDDPFYSHFSLFGHERALPGAAHRFGCGDPELSRRVIRLVYANLLARVDRPPVRPAVRVLFGPHKKGVAPPWSLELYDNGPDAPSAARALSPQELGRRILKTWDAQHLLVRIASRHHIFTRARARKGDLAYLLAEEWYRREHEGDNPPSPEALLGRYLKKLPVPEELPGGESGVPTIQDKDVGR